MLRKYNWFAYIASGHESNNEIDKLNDDSPSTVSSLITGTSINEGRDEAGTRENVRGKNQEGVRQDDDD